MIFTLQMIEDGDSAVVLVLRPYTSISTARHKLVVHYSLAKPILVFSSLIM